MADVLYFIIMYLTLFFKQPQRHFINLNNFFMNNRIF